MFYDPENDYTTYQPLGDGRVMGPNGIIQAGEVDSIQKLANDLNLKLDDQTKDYLVQYYLQEKGSENAMSRSREFNREQYSDLVAGLQKAGLNPFLALQGLSGANMMQGQSTQSGLYTQARNASKQANANVAGSAMSLIGSLLFAVAIVAAHAL